MTGLVRAFKFQVWLTRSASPGPTMTPPPDLKAEAAPAAPPAGGRPTQPPGDPVELGDGRFQECTGLDLEADVREYLEGGRNDAVIRRLTRVKLQPIVLKRGVLVPAEDEGYADTALWRWLQDAVAGDLPLPRYDGTVEVLDPTMTRVTARWTFTRALPGKVTGPQLHARTGEIAIEELHLVHEGLEMEDGP